MSRSRKKAAEQNAHDVESGTVRSPVTHEKEAKFREEDAWISAMAHGVDPKNVSFYQHCLFPLDRSHESSFAGWIFYEKSSERITLVSMEEHTVVYQGKLEGVPKEMLSRGIRRSESCITKADAFAFASGELEEELDFELLEHIEVCDSCHKLVDEVNFLFDTIFGISRDSI